MKFKALAKKSPRYLPIKKIIDAVFYSSLFFLYSDICDVLRAPIEYSISSKRESLYRLPSYHSTAYFRRAFGNRVAALNCAIMHAPFFTARRCIYSDARHEGNSRHYWEQFASRLSLTSIYRRILHLSQNQ